LPDAPGFILDKTLGFITSSLRVAGTISGERHLRHVHDLEVKALPVQLDHISKEPQETIMITLTDTAAVKVKELLEAEGALDMALRVAVRPGGCSGFSYEMFFDSDITDDDEQAEYGESVKVVVDQASAQLLLGATLDYKDGLNQAGFNIINPNATRSCGCGQSFS
jgi:iron-sulfur cluster assembly protein/iron-sulfur cluster insertion protein